MGQIAISCDQVVDFLEENKFSFMKRVRSFKFLKNKIQFRIKVSILKPKVTIKFKSFKNGIWHVQADSGEFLEDLAKLFGLVKRFKKGLEEGEFKDFIKMEKDFNFKIDVNGLLAYEKVKVYGIKVTDIQMNDKMKMKIFFDVKAPPEPSSTGQA